MQRQSTIRPRPAATLTERVAMLACAVAALLAMAVSPAGDTKFDRPDPRTEQHLASCQLQSLRKPARQPMLDGVQFMPTQPVADDALANYQRTPLGDWQMPEEVDRTNPWLRFLLLGPTRPLVIDVAVYVDGKPYADGRETWIDEALSDKQAAPDAPAEPAAPPAGDVPSPNTAALDTKPTQPESTEPKAKKVVATVQSEPMVAAQVRHAPTMRERLQRYLATAGPTVDRKAIRWLIAEWGFGPPLVVMDSSLSWQRATTAPLLAYLDSDRDGALSAAEIAQVDNLLHRADFNADDVVEESEIRRQNDAPPVIPFATGHPLVVLLDVADDVDALAAEVARIYGMGAEQFRQLARGGAGVTLRVDFRGDAKTPAGVALLGVGPEFAGVADAVTASADVIALDLGAEYIEFSAAQGEIGTKSDENVGTRQIAVGAAFDGNPLMRLVDRDQDHRLTLRERREIGGLLAALDRDDDGQIAAAEMPIPIRFAVTLGPQVHALLAQASGAARAIAPRETLAAPSWFASMDRNGDGDLSRGEFLGTAEQFGQMDADGDGLVSIGEALKTEAGK
jgi:EF hand